MRKTRFELFKGTNKEWYFALRSSNGKTICQSEGYKRKGSALKGIKSIQKNAPKAKIETVLLLSM